MATNNEDSGKTQSLLSPGLLRVFIGVFSVWCFSLLERLLSPFLHWFPPSGVFTASMVEHASGLLLKLLMFWVAAWGLGFWVLSVLKSRDLSLGERAVLSMGVGAGLIGLGGLGLGLAAMATPVRLETLVWFLFWGGCATLVNLVLTQKADFKVKIPLEFQLPLEAILPFIYLVILGVYNGLLALAPPVSYDTLVYHLGLPQFYLLRGAIVPTPFHIYSGIPFGIEMLYMWLLPLNPAGYLCQLLHWSLGLLTVGVIVLTARRLGSLSAGIWAAAIFYSSPMVIVTSRNANIELGSSFFVALTLLALICWESQKELGWLIVIGALSGFAIGTKYQLVVILPALAAYFIQAQGFRAGVRSLACAGSIAMGVASPWFIKNVLFYGNPIYPFWDERFSSHSVVLPGVLASSARARDLGQVFGTWGGFSDFLMQFWKYSFRQTNDLESLLSIVFLMCLPLLFVSRLRQPAIKLFLFGTAMWVPMNLMSAMTRFSIPILPALSLAVAFVLISLPQTIGDVARAILPIGFFVSAFCGYNVGGIDGRWVAMESPEKALEFLSNSQPTYPNPSFVAFLWANEHLPKDAKVLLIGEQRAFHLDRDRLAASVYAKDPLELFVKASSSGDDLYERLRHEGVTHIFINRMNEFAGYELTAGEKKVLGDFWSKHAGLIYLKAEPNPADVLDLSLFALVDRVPPVASRKMPALFIKQAVLQALPTRN